MLTGSYLLMLPEPIRGFISSTREQHVQEAAANIVPRSSASVQVSAPSTQVHMMGTKTHSKANRTGKLKEQKLWTEQFHLAKLNLLPL